MSNLGTIVPSSSEGSWEDKLAIIYCENCGELPNENMCKIYKEVLEKARQELLQQLLDEMPKDKSTKFPEDPDANRFFGRMNESYNECNSLWRKLLEAKINEE